MSRRTSTISRSATRSRRWLDVCGAVFFNGAFVENAPNATWQGDATHFYADLELMF